MYALLDLIKHLYPCVQPPEPLSGKHTGRKVQCLPGIPHQELCRTFASGSKAGRVSSKNIGEIKEILKGNTQEIERMLFQQMQELAAEMKFEEAQKIKEKYLLIGKLPGEIGSGKQRAAQYRRVLHRRRQR